MSIPSAELIHLLQDTLPGAAPAERGTMETYIGFIERAGITARLDSEASKFLSKTAADFRPYWQPDAVDAFRTADVYGVEVPVINGFARMEKQRRQIVLFEGILQLMGFYADFITVLNLLMQRRPDAQIAIDGWTEKESSSFSLAGFSLIHHFMQTGQPLPEVGDLLGPAARQNARIGYEAGTAFLLAHELGHLVLGHTGPSGAVAERNQVALVLEENINRYQENEFAADRYALFAFREDLRLPLMSSVIFFFGPMAFIEAFARPTGETHPLFTNRAAHLASLLPSEGDDAIAVANIINGQIGGFKRLAAERGSTQEDIRPRIHQTMPVDLATRTLRTVKQAVRQGAGLLDI